MRLLTIANAAAESILWKCCMPPFRRSCTLMRPMAGTFLSLSLSTATQVPGHTIILRRISVRLRYLGYVKRCLIVVAPGLTYPNATGNDQPHDQQVERKPSTSSVALCNALPYPRSETGNMLIMSLAYARSNGDGSLLYRYVSDRSDALGCTNLKLL